MNPAVATNRFGAMVELREYREILSMPGEWLKKLGNRVIGPCLAWEKQMGHEAKTRAHANHPYGDLRLAGCHYLQARQCHHGAPQTPQECPTINPKFT